MWRDSMFIENGLGRLLHHPQWGIPARTPPAEVIGNMRHSEGMPCGYGVLSLHIMYVRVAPEGTTFGEQNRGKLLPFLVASVGTCGGGLSIDVP